MPSDLEEFGLSYATAWSSHDPARVASFFAPTGSLRVNDAEPATGTAALIALAQGFFTELPDLIVSMDGIHRADDRIVFEWTLTGTSRAGRPVRVSGQESWRLDADGLIADSIGSFDGAEYSRQLGS